MKAISTAYWSEFFYGYRGEPEKRLVHGVDLMQEKATRTEVNDQSVEENIALCSEFGAPNAGLWWAETIAFDTLIGNSDRHTENWGVLVHDAPNSTTAMEMSPAYDNGTSLAYEILENQLSRMNGSALQRYVAKGNHHPSWSREAPGSNRHGSLCSEMIRADRQYRASMEMWCD